MNSLQSPRMLENTCEVKNIHSHKLSFKRNKVFMNIYLTIIKLDIMLHFEHSIKL